ncbi:MAG: CDP-diacylglycerol diphosphatase [Beijerinckiaceae bacterium]|jgi:CDP-diacylglycerol pyrophosphatase
MTAQRYRRESSTRGTARTLLVFSGVVLLLSGGLAVAQSAKRAMLWHVVQLCTANKQITGVAFPCVDADLSKGTDVGYVVLHAPLDPAHNLVVVPTIPIAGVESPFLREPDAPNYFADAWQARRFVEASVPRALQREDIGLALNSRPGRAQDQLHIHVDCLDHQIRDTLRAHAASFKTDSWTKLPFDLAGERYWGLRLNSQDIAGINVFRLVFDGLHVPETDSAKVTIVLAGATFEKSGPGFYLLAAVAGRTHNNQGHGEYLLDHDCEAG